MLGDFKKADQTFSVTNRLRQSPYLLLPAFGAWLKGWVYKIWLPLTGRKFRAGRRFRVYGSLYVSGPGSVRFGDDCIVIGNAIKSVYLRTLSPTAVISVGDFGGFNGTSVQCIEAVHIGRLSNIADAYITDTAAHVLDSNRRSISAAGAPKSPVHIAENVWISVQVVVLHGSVIGANSVIGACSLVRGQVPQNVFAAGNPLKVIRTLPDMETNAPC